MFRQFTVTDTQTVHFVVGPATGPSIGGPTTLTALIDRNTTPDAPDHSQVNIVSNTLVYYSFSDGDSNGGDPIDLRQVSYRKVTDAPGDVTIQNTDLSGVVDHLIPGTAYYFWFRTHNRWGYSDWGARLLVTTRDKPSAPGLPLVSDITQITAKITAVDGYDGGSGVTSRQVQYFSTNPVTAPIVVNYTGPTTITGLTPGRKYYVQTRATNTYGTSDWGPLSNFTTLTGVRINVGGTWKTAIPYVNVGGVWKLAKPFGRQFGYWEETS
jgi:hypothetical protein